MFKENDLVQFNGKQGYVRYHGKVHFRGGIWVGIELKEPIGKNDGEVIFKGTKRRYFKCRPNYGLFAKSQNVVRVQQLPRDSSKRSSYSAASSRNQNTQSIASARGLNSRILKSTLEDYQSQIMEKDHLIEEKDFLITDLQQKLIRKEQDVRIMEDKLDNLSLDMSKFEESFNPSLVKELKLENAKLQKSLTEADGEIKLIQEHYSKIIESQKSALNTLKNEDQTESSHSEQMKKLRFLVEEKDSKIHNLELLLSKRNTSSDVESRHWELEKSLHEYQMKLTELEVSMSASLSEKESLENKVHFLEEELKLNRENLLEIQKEKSNLISKLSAISAENIELKKQSKIDSDFDRNESSLEEISKIQQEKRSLEDLFDIKENNFVTEINMLKRSNTMLKQKVSSLNKELQLKSDDLVQVSKNMLNLESGFVQKIAQIEAELEEMVHLKQVVENDYNSSKNTVVRLENELNILKEENERLVKHNTLLKKSRKQTMSSYIDNVEKLMSDMNKIQETVDKRNSATSNRSSLLETENKRISKESAVSSSAYDEEFRLEE
eukprot:NODE_50_length_31184_cov_0.705099.p4 type:complete len:552 gc:universal NODE_50_length_31184_cov_0.705099:22737-24392(+)